MSTLRDEILLFLRDPRAFAATLPPDRAGLWVRGLTEFARPRLDSAGGQPLRPAQVRAWEGLAPHRVGLLLGPPGTGKTHLLAWMAAGYVHACRAAGNPCRVLATGFTRESMANLLNKFAEVAAAELPWVKLAFLGNLPDGRLDRLVAPLGLRGKDGAREAWDVLRGRENWYSVSAATNWSLGKLLRSDQRPDDARLEADGHTARLFDLVLIDEASQSLVSQGLMSLAGLAREGRVIVCGDDRQLAPVRATSEAVVAGREVGGSLYRFLASSGVAEFALEDTFRLNAPLVEFPAREFYADRFVSAVPARRLALRDGWSAGLSDWERLALDPENPVVVLLHDGPPAGTDNPFERDLIARLVERLAVRLPPSPGLADLDEDTLWAKRLAVVTPHRAQNAAIRDALRRTPLCRRPRVDTVDKVQGQERDAVVVGYGVADPEFAQTEADFLFDPGRLNVAVTRPKSKLILVVSRRLFEVTPPDDETFESADLLRRFVYECRPAGVRELPGPEGRHYSVEFRVRGFAGITPTPLPAVEESPGFPILRLTYSGDPPTNAQLRDRLGLAGTEYLYLTATQAIEWDRKDIAPPAQRTDDPEKPALRFDRLFRHLLRSRRVLKTGERRICLRRGVEAAVADEQLRDAVLHDVPAWLDALATLEQRGEDVTNGVRPALLDELTSPALAPILTTLQAGYRAAKPPGADGYEEAARKFIDAELHPPPLVVLEGFAYLLPLQAHFVRRCLDRGSRVVFVHPQEHGQPDAFLAMDRAYAAYDGQAERDEVVTELRSPGHDLRLLQRGLFAATPPAAPRGDGSVTIAAYPHRHREVAACLRKVKEYLDGPDVDGRKPRPADVAVVTRRPGEFLTVLQEEARRLGLLDRVRIEPRLLLLTPLGRFALTLYELAPEGSFEVTADQFEGMLASGWLGAAAQQTIEAFAAVRAQAFDRCRTPDQWDAAFAGLAANDPNAPELARLPGTATTANHLAAWRRALARVADLHARLFDGERRSIGDHIRRLRDELSRLNPDDLREDERDLALRILAALEEVVGPADLEIDTREVGGLLVGAARGDHREDDDDFDPGKVWVTTPEAVDGTSRLVVHYLGVDSSRVPRPAGMPWPFFDLNPDRDVERERYLFLAVARAARRELHLSYSRHGEDEGYTPSAYLSAAARLLGREKDLEPPSAPTAPPRPASVPLPVLPGRADGYDLHDVAAFGLCPYRFRLERFDPSARRFRDGYQLRSVALGVWMDRAFQALVGGDRYTDAGRVRRALYDAALEVRGAAGELFPALGPIDPDDGPSVHWEAVRRHLKESLDQLVDDWLAKPKENGKTPLDWGVSFADAPPGVEFTLDVDGRTVVVRSGLRHVILEGRFPKALPNALTHQHWLRPSYRAGEESEDGPEEVDGVEVFPDLKSAVTWWRNAIRAAMGKDANRDDFRESYRQYQGEAARLVRTIQAGRFPKHPGDHCELCPVRHTCLGTPEA